MSDVTRDVTRDIRRESRSPYRPDPNLTGPIALKARVETPHHGVAYVTREAGDAMMTATRQEIAS